MNKNNFLTTRFLQNNLVLICYKGLQSLFQVEWNFWSKISGSVDVGTSVVCVTLCSSLPT